jgi:hypothetical protein
MFVHYSPLELTSLLDRSYQAAFEFQRVRHDDWTQNYTFYRDRVITNRLTQRQTVVLPMMKATVKTVLSKYMLPPSVSFYNKDNDKEREIFMNILWEESFRSLHGDKMDFLDKKNQALYGRGIRTLGVTDGKVAFSELDPYDLLVDPATDPVNPDISAQYMIRDNIYKTVGEIRANPWYDQLEVDKILKKIDPKTGSLPAYDEADIDKGQRLMNLGHSWETQVSATTKIKFREFYLKLPNKDTKEDNIYFIPAICYQPLACIPLEQVIGETNDNFWRYNFPFITWGDDPDINDFWSDGVGDIVRPANKVINAWWSQLVENRTLRNLNMFFYNSSNERFIPQTFDPEPFGFYPIPGNPNEIMLPMQIPELKDSIEEIGFLKQILEQATAATATMQGQLEKSQTTLGEIQLTLSNANQRIQSISPFYCDGYEDLGLKFYKMYEAGANNNLIDSNRLYKRGYNNNIFSDEIKPDKIISPSGYEVRAVALEQQGQAQMDDLQRLNLAITTMPNNAALKRIYKEKILKTIDLTAEEINEIRKAEEEVAEQLERDMIAQNQVETGSVQQQPNSYPDNLSSKVQQQAMIGGRQ